METINLALIGAGRAGAIHARNIAQRIPGARLVSVCDLNEAVAGSLARELGVTACKDHRQVLADTSVDAVVIVTPTFVHQPIACAAASCGKHIFLEKPMALSVEECRSIQAAVDRAGVKLQIGFMRRFDEGFARAKDLLDSGELGRVMIIKSTGRGPGGPGPWMYDLRKSNGIIAEVNSHDIDSLLWYTGARILRVYAEAHNFKCPEARVEWPDFYDNVVATLRFEGGAIGVIDGTCPAQYGYDARVEILCEKGALFIGSTRQQGVTHITVEGRVQDRAVRSWRHLFKEAYLSEMEHFVECLRAGKSPRVTGEDGLRAVEAVMGINESIRTGQPVELMERTAA